MSKNIKDTFESFGPSEEQKKRIYDSAAAGRLGIDRRKRYAWKLKLALVPLGGVLLIAVGVTLLVGLNNRNAVYLEPEHTQFAQSHVPDESAVIVTDRPRLFSGLVLTVYQAKGGEGYLPADYAELTEKQVLTPGVSVPLAKYSPLMSSVPGLPFTVDIAGEAEHVSVKISVNQGELNEWDRETGVVTSGGQLLSISPGETIYWSPGPESNASDITITIETSGHGAIAGRQEISITQDKEGYYQATVGDMEMYEQSDHYS